MPQHIIPKITIGADPEVFVRNLDTGLIVSAHDLLPGTKDKPSPCQYGAIQVDGVAGEFNIRPAQHAEHFQVYCHHMVKAIKTRLGPKYELVLEPVAYFDPGYFETLPKATKELGCNPDYNAWTGLVNDPPQSVISDGRVMRTAAGHVHVGWTDKQDIKDPSVFSDACVVARQLDYFVGIFSLMWDPDPTRRQMYGKAGSLRVKPYGMEYRPMSNKWLQTMDLQYWVCNAAMTAMSQLFSGNSLESKFGDTARRIIDDNITDWYERPDMATLRSSIPVVNPPVPGMKSAGPKKKSSYSYLSANEMPVAEWGTP